MDIVHHDLVYWLLDIKPFFAEAQLVGINERCTFLLSISDHTFISCILCLWTSTAYFLLSCCRFVDIHVLSCCVVECTGLRSSARHARYCAALFPFQYYSHQIWSAARRIKVFRDKTILLALLMVVRGIIISPIAFITASQHTARPRLQQIIYRNMSIV